MMVAGIAMANPEISLRAGQLAPSSRPCVSEPRVAAANGRHAPSSTSWTGNGAIDCQQSGGKLRPADNKRRQKRLLNSPLFARPALPRHPARPDQDDDRRRRRRRVPGWPARHDLGRMVGAGRHFETPHHSRHRPLGSGRGPRPDAAVDQPDRQAPLCRGGLDPRDFSMHGLRAGYLTEAARHGVSLPEEMQQSQHWSVQQGRQLLQRSGTAARQGGAAGGVARAGSVVGLSSGTRLITPPPLPP